MPAALWHKGQALLSSCWRGLLLCALVALAARFLADHYGAPAMLMALLLGMALHFVSAQAQCQAGIDLASRQVLRWGVALLGLRVSLEQVLSLGWGTVLMVVITVLATIGAGVLLARAMGLHGPLGLISGGAVGICGASAAMALASCLPPSRERERDLAWTVMGVSILSTLAMLSYPLLASALGLGEWHTGVFLGASIHDVAQVVGAGYSVSTTSGDVAIVSKLMRVAMLVPVLLMVTLMVPVVLSRRVHAGTLRAAGGENLAPPDTPVLPGFALAFVALVLLQSAVTLPPQWLMLGQGLSQWALLLAMAAIGLKSQPAQWRAMGWRPVLLLVAETVLLAMLVLVWLRVWPVSA